MIIIVGEAGAGKSSIEDVLITKYGYQKTVSEVYTPHTVCVVTPNGLRELNRRLDKEALDIHSFYIKVPRRTRLIKMLQRGDDIEQVIRRDRKDTERYQGIECEVDFVVENIDWFSDPENMAERLLYQIRRSRSVG